MHQLSIILHYKDGTESRLTVAVPAEVADEIQTLGLAYTTVTIDRIIQVPTQGTNAQFDDFKRS